MFKKNDEREGKVVLHVTVRDGVRLSANRVLVANFQPWRKFRNSWHNLENVLTRALTTLSHHPIIVQSLRIVNVRRFLARSSTSRT